MRIRLMAWLWVLLILSGCAGIGTTTVSRDRFDYTEAISDSWKRQMLLNMVKIRYGDAPVFLDVSSVISQYQIAGQINLAATMDNHPWSSSETLGAFGQYVDRPTITYVPISGDKFARSMMAPIPPPAVLSLMQAGYPVDLVLRLLVQEINGIRNRSAVKASARSGDPMFYSLIEKMRTIQSAGGVGMRFTKTDKGQAATLIILKKQDTTTEALSIDVRKILGVDPHANDFNVVYGAVPSNDKEIALLTRSFLQIISELSADIEIPAVHVEEKRANPNYVEEAADGRKISPLIRIVSSAGSPDDAFVSIPYRKSYFWIDDRDLSSKKIFSFLMFIFTLVETGDKGLTPVVTVPTN